MTAVESPVELALVLRLMAALVGVHGVVTALEHLASIHRLRAGGILDWEVSRLYVRMAPFAGWTRHLLAPSRFEWVLGARLVAGGLLAGLAAAGHVSALLLLVLFATDVGIVIRHMSGLSGAFQMAIIVTTGTFLATVFPDGSVAQLAAVLFVAGQSALSYLVAGMSKLISEEWRSGTAVEGVFSTEVFGHERIYELLVAHPWLNPVAAWAVIGFECIFPLVLLVDQQWVPVFLAVGVVFHASNAVFMGLNTFLVAFPATYPAVVYANAYLHQFLP